MSFTLKCDKCGKSVQLTEESVIEMQDDYIDMIIEDTSMFKRHHININFGNAGGKYGILEIRCICGNEVDGSEV